MSLGRGRLVALCAVTSVIAAIAPAPAHAVPDNECGTARAGTVLFLHGGGFLLPPFEHRLRRACLRFGRDGFAARTVRYPLGDVPGAIAHVRAVARAARANGPVYAYGQSAGGTLAALLAADGLVDAAVAEAAPTNLLTWRANDRGYWEGRLRMSEADRAAASPVFAPARRSRPLLLMHSPDDEVVGFGQSAELAGELPDAELLRLSGLHLADRRAWRAGFRWIQATRTGDRPRGRGRWFSRG